jgi:hypothetical protein
MSVGLERRKCPAEFQSRLTRMFGKNQFGEPLIKVVWGQSQFIRMGNEYRGCHGESRVGYRNISAGNACWQIMRWKAPINYGSPDVYYANTYMSIAQRFTDDGMPFDDAEGFYVTGEYPWRGRYETMYALQKQEYVHGRLVVEHLPLTHYLIDTIIPMVLAFQRLTKEEQEAARTAARIAEEKKENETIAEAFAENLPRWWGPVSYSRQGIRTSLLDRKMHAIQQVWNRMAKQGQKPKFSRGMQVGDKPHVMN